MKGCDSATLGNSAVIYGMNGELSGVETTHSGIKYRPKKVLNNCIKIYDFCDSMSSKLTYSQLTILQYLNRTYILAKTMQL